MKALPEMDGVIDRRLLLNFRVDPEIAGRIVPPPFRPNLSRGVAIAGICIIRLTELRPRGLPRSLGISTESAAHRVAVEWDTDRGLEHGVYIPRRDTDSRMSVLLGGRVFPGVHHRASFHVREGEGRYDIDLMSADNTTHVGVCAAEDRTWPTGSVFRDVEDASEFFRRDSVGYSPTRAGDAYDGLELRAESWNIEALAVERVTSSFFDDPARFPTGTVAFDCALSMRRTAARWNPWPQLATRALSPAT
jgi:uncharacterized protein YqjF (DUF2071 family)